MADEDYDFGNASEIRIRGVDRCKRCGHPLRAATSRFIGLGAKCLEFVVVRKWTGEEVRQLAFETLWNMADKSTDPQPRA